MIEAHSLPEPTGVWLRHAFAAEDAPPARWREDARFFATAYLAALVFFLLMLA